MARHTPHPTRQCLRLVVVSLKRIIAQGQFQERTREPSGQSDRVTAYPLPPLGGTPFTTEFCTAFSDGLGSLVRGDTKDKDFPSFETQKSTLRTWLVLGGPCHVGHLRGFLISLRCS